MLRRIEPDAKVKTRYFDIVYPRRWAAQVRLVAMLLELATSDVQADLGLQLECRPMIVIRRGSRLNFYCHVSSATVWLDFAIAPVLDGLRANAAFGVLHELGHLYLSFPQSPAKEAWANFIALYALRTLAHRPLPTRIKWVYLYKDYFTALALMKITSLFPGLSGDIGRYTLRIWRGFREEGLTGVRRYLLEQMPK